MMKTTLHVLCFLLISTACNAILHSNSNTNNQRRNLAAIGEPSGDCKIKSKQDCVEAAKLHNISFSKTITNKIDGNKWGCVYDEKADQIYFDHKKGKKKDCGGKKCKNKQFKYPIKVDGFARVFCTAEKSSTLAPTGTPTSTPTIVVEAITDSPTGSPTASLSTSPTTSQSLAPSQSPTASPTVSPSASHTTIFPSASPTAFPSADSSTDSPTASPTASPSATPTGPPTASPSAFPTTNFPSLSPTASPSADSSTDSPTTSPAASPSASPTDPPTASPSAFPATNFPSLSPTASPSADSSTNWPTVSPTASPSASSTDPPTVSPSASPTTRSPSASPTASPSTDSSTDLPSLSPTASPSSSPTDSPTVSPPAAPKTNSPSASPTASPSADSSTDSPTVSSTASPSASPTDPPTVSPSASFMTSFPSAFPTTSPSADSSTDSPTIVEESEEPSSASSSTPSIEASEEPSSASSFTPSIVASEEHIGTKSSSISKSASTIDEDVGVVDTEAPTNSVATTSKLSPVATDAEEEEKEESIQEKEQEIREPVTTCFDYTKAVLLGKDCNWWTLFHRIRDEYILQNVEDARCSGGLTIELRRLTNTVETTGEEWKDALGDLCDKALYEDAMGEVESVDWSRIEDADVNLEEYFNGQGFLNNEYGNLQQMEAKFERRGGKNRYRYRGTNPTQNDYLPTPQRSVDGGDAINKFYTEDATTKLLTAPSFSKLENGCPKTNAAMCCWSRDRQYNDNNGSCNSNGHCRNGDPGDNTDLCWTKGKGDDDVFPYPTQESEGALHCHGYSWSNFDISDTTKYNNLFYISMYDHLYTRGYVQSITDEPNLQGVEQPLCGCVEDMNPVARADCTEIIPRATFTAYQNDDGYLVVEHNAGTLELEYKACEGYDYDADVTPDDWLENSNNVNELKLKRQDNDLSAYVYRQYLEGKKDVDQTKAFEGTIIGYKDPRVNDGDEEREVACKAAFEKQYPDQEWVTPVKEQEIEI